MGFINNVKGSTAGKDAAEARDRGDLVFVYKAIEANKGSLNSGPMTGMSEQIQAIEAQGWALVNMAAAEGKAMTGERIALVMLFRRR